MFKVGSFYKHVNMKDVDFKVMDILNVSDKTVKVKVAYRNVNNKSFIDMIDETVNKDKLKDFKETEE